MQFRSLLVFFVFASGFTIVGSTGAFVAGVGLWKVNNPTQITMARKAPPKMPRAVQNVDDALSGALNTPHKQASAQKVMLKMAPATQIVARGGTLHPITLELSAPATADAKGAPERLESRLALEIIRSSCGDGVRIDGNMLYATPLLLALPRKVCTITLAARMGGTLSDNVSASLSVPNWSRKSLALGSAHSCAIDQSGKVKCWGDNSKGQTQVPENLESPLALTAGDNFTCALTGPVGAVKCWGELPFAASAISSNLLALDAKGDTLCGIDLENNLTCWGRSPATVPADLGKVATVSVARKHICAYTSQAVLKCFGETTFDEAPPEQKADVLGLFSGEQQTCVISTKSKANCYGKAVTRVVADLANPQALSLGQQHICALDREGAVNCWGDNTHNQTILPENPGRIVSLEAGQNHTCAVDGEGKVLCWGENSLKQATPPQDLHVKVVEW